LDMRIAQRLRKTDREGERDTHTDTEIDRQSQRRHTEPKRLKPHGSRKSDTPKILC